MIEMDKRHKFLTEFKATRVVITGTITVESTRSILKGLWMWHRVSAVINSCLLTELKIHSYNREHTLIYGIHIYCLQIIVRLSCVWHYVTFRCNVYRINLAISIIFIFLFSNNESYMGLRKNTLGRSIMHGYRLPCSITIIHIVCACTKVFIWKLTLTISRIKNDGNVSSLVRSQNFMDDGHLKYSSTF